MAEQKHRYVSLLSGEVWVDFFPTYYIYTVTHQRVKGEIMCHVIYTMNC